MSGIGGVGGSGGIGGFSSAGGLAEILALRQQLIDKSQLLQQVHTPQTAAGTATGTAPAGSGGFSGALENALQTVNAGEQKADALTSAYEKGQVTDVAKVMLAREQASVGFEGALQVRNKLLSAYQDIMKLGV